MNKMRIDHGVTNQYVACRFQFSDHGPLCAMAFKLIAVTHCLKLDLTRPVPGVVLAVGEHGPQNLRIVALCVDDQ